MAPGVETKLSVDATRVCLLTQNKIPFGGEVRSGALPAFAFDGTLNGERYTKM